MKIILFSRSQSESHIGDIVSIFDAIARYSFEYMVNEEFAVSIERLVGRSIPHSLRYGSSVGHQGSEAVMVCYGGDGTLLEGVHRLEGETIPVVGINSGRLGFLALAGREQIDAVFEQIACNNLQIEERQMLCVEGVLDGERRELHALNEIAVQRLGASMISVDVAVDGKPTLVCYGDGVVVSTPTGSTAYSLSAGGPIVAPSCRCMVITPLSPHNLTIRPLVVADSSVVSLVIHTRSNEASLSIDNRTYKVSDGMEVEVKLSKRAISLAVPHNISFYDTLRNKMMWGVDLR